jgi:hypothetical protein
MDVLLELGSDIESSPDAVGVPEAGEVVPLVVDELDELDETSELGADMLYCTALCRSWEM